MRSLVLDELRPSDQERLRGYLSRVLEPSSLPEVFWLHLPPDLLSPIQAEHQEQCGPHRVALVLEMESLRLELLVRSQNSLRCTCTGYASKAQRDFCLNFLDRLIKELDLST
jgi:hypothetical protein